MEFDCPNSEKDANKYAWTAPAGVKTSLSKLRLSRPADSVAFTSHTITPRAMFGKSEEDAIKIETTPLAASMAGPDMIATNGPAGQTPLNHRIKHHPCDFINERLLALVSGFHIALCANLSAHAL